MQVHLYIFSFLEAIDLGRMAQVSIYFSRLAGDDEVWAAVTALNFPSYLPKERIEHFTFKCTNVISIPFPILIIQLIRLSLVDCVEQVDDEFVERVLDFSHSSLKHLNLSGCSKATQSSFEKFTELCPDMISLDLSGVSLPSLSEFYESVITSCHSLESLHISSTFTSNP